MGRPFASPDLPSSNCTHLSSSPAPPIHTTVLNSQPCRYLSFSACFPPAPHNQPSILILFFFVPCQVLLISNLFHGYLPLYTSCLRPPGPWTFVCTASGSCLFQPIRVFMPVAVLVQRRDSMNTCRFIPPALNLLDHGL